MAEITWRWQSRVLIAKEFCGKLGLGGFFILAKKGFLN
jgi:hypothetical protein